MPASARSAIFSVLLVFAPALWSCIERTKSQPPDKTEAVDVRLGQEFDLKVGQQAKVAGENLQIKFVSVASDSRCPVDVTCVWAGNAEVMIQVELKAKATDIKLNTNGGDKLPKEARHEQYTVALVKLNPQPRSNQPIKSSEYAATLIFRRV